MIMSPPNCNEIMSPPSWGSGLKLEHQKEVLHERRGDIYDARNDTVQSHSFPTGGEDGQQGYGFGSAIVRATSEEDQEEGKGNGPTWSGSWK